MRRHAATLLVFIGLFACYTAMSPGSVAGMGYTGEEMRSGRRMLDIIDAFRRGSPRPPMIWSRHGPLPVLFDVPFLALRTDAYSEDYFLSFQSPLLTALLVTLLFSWLRKLTSPGMTLLLTFAAAFGTMLWPYAFIGLETKQSLFILAAAYLALAPRAPRNWPATILFALCCGFAVAVKSTSIVLFPAVLYLIWVRFRSTWRQQYVQPVIVVSIVAVVWAGGAIGRIPFWGTTGGVNALRDWMIDQPFAWIANVLGMFGSPNKGLLLFAPVLLLSLYLLPRVFRGHRELAVFTCLLLAGLVSFLALLRGYADEVWGSRYLHSAIAPLIVVLGAARDRFQLRRDLFLVGLVVLGFAISFLGAFYYYGVMHLVATQTGENTSEHLIGDSTWNHVDFNLRLFRLWLSGGNQPVLWTPRHTWMFAPLPGTLPPTTIELRHWSEPQSVLIRKWNLPKYGPEVPVHRFYFVCLLLGPLSLTSAAFLTLRPARIAPADPVPVRKRMRAPVRH